MSEVLTTPATDSLFHEVPDCQVVLYSGGVYRQAKLYRRYAAGEKEHRLYAKSGTGFVCLHGSGVTSAHSVRYEFADVDGAMLARGWLGRPVLSREAAYLLELSVDA